MQVVLAEKPSVGRDLARILGIQSKRQGFLEGSGIRITWCVGHMCQLAEPSQYDPAWKRWSLDQLPMIPEDFQLVPRKTAADQLKVLKRLLTDERVTEVVNACDAGREGELIFRYTYEWAGCVAPVRRFWASSLTDQAVKKAWANLRPGREYDNLADAARSRSEADWLVGLNATRALTCRSRDVGPGALLSLGRVQTPTLAMIVGRDAEIEAFQSRDFWRIVATVPGAEGTEPAQWEANWFLPGAPSGGKREDEDGDAERLWSETSAEQLQRALVGRRAVVTRADKRSKVDKPPLLYDLTALQRRANQRYGLSAKRVLEVAQALYETHKLLTYPRTDARHLTPDQVPGLRQVVESLKPIPPYLEACERILSSKIAPGKRVVNAAEVGDHHAILPTGRTPRPGRLSPDEKRVFDLVARRLLAALSPDAKFNLTDIHLEAIEPGELPEDVPPPVMLRARGRVTVHAGWRVIDPPKEKKDKVLPQLDKGDEVTLASVDVRAGQTRPPRPHTDASLLYSMETAGKGLEDRELARAMRSQGLGTPATRAAILQTLLDRGFVQRDKKALVSTEMGRTLIGAVTVEELKSAELTGRWEGRLSEISDGGFERATFMNNVRTYTARIVQSIREAPAPVVEGPRDDDRASLGDCPGCSKPVRRRGPVWSCDSGRSCPFVVFETMSGRTISERMVKALLKTGRSQMVKGFKSRAGKEFSAALSWDVEQRKVRFAFEDRPQRPETLAVGAPCPRCATGQVIQGRTQRGCSRWREGCEWRSGSAT